MLRLFVALPLPEPVRRQLADIAWGLAGVRWTPIDNYHLTLRFLGDIDGRTMADIDAALAGIRAPAFRLQLRGVGHFSSGARIRTVWAGVEKEAALLHLQQKVESAVVRAGVPPHGQKYTPHVTLIHNAASVHAAKLQLYLAQHNLFRSDGFDVTCFNLYSSRMGHDSSVYRIERQYELRPQSVSIETASPG